MSLDTDRWVAWGAMLVGVSSIVIAVYQTQLERQTQHASVMPYLMIGIMDGGQGSFVTLANTGIGPALIDDVRIHYKGKTIQADPYDFYKSLKPDAQVSVDRIVKGRLYPAGAYHLVLGVGPSERQSLMTKEIVQLFDLADVPRAWLTTFEAEKTDKAIIEITYSSVYGDRWRIRSNSLVPEEL